MPDDISIKLVRSSPVPEELDWPPLTPGFVLECAAFPGVLEAVSQIPVDEAHFRYTAECMGGGGPVLVNPKFVLILGPIDSQKPPFGLLNPFYEDGDIHAYRPITGPIMDTEEKRWTLGVTHGKKMFLWYVEDAKVVAKATWKTAKEIALADDMSLAALERVEVLPN